MKPSDDCDAGKGGQFMTTCWSAVLLSAQSQAPGSDKAREEFCQLYWYPLYAFIRRRGYNPDDARDLTQGFFLFILGRKALQRATPEKGKFRSFLLGSLKNYLSNVYQHENAIKRGGKIDFVPVDFSDGEDRYSREPTDSLTPEKIFDANCALTLLGRAIERLKEEYFAQGKATVFKTLRPFLDVSGAAQAPSYEVVAGKLKVSGAGVKTLIHRLRKRYSEILREAVAQTVSDPNQIDDEIRSLCDALIASEGRLRP
ncbi:MAG TPA: sigma-70 family RNA polymerase sigma factor [Chthoniobacterales bacterium]|nr:sigma-70 family RNA polymerase sigma factor [Chthoniobacterales bacterium]